MSHTELSKEKIEEIEQADEIELEEVASCKLEKPDKDESGAKIRCEVWEEVWEHITDEPVKEVSFEVADTTEEEEK